MPTRNCRPPQRQQEHSADNSQAHCTESCRASGALHTLPLLQSPRRPGPLRVWLLVLEEEGRSGRGGRARAAFQEDGVTLTKPSLLLSLDFDGQAKVSQLDCGTLAFTRQQQVLRLRKEKTEPCEAPTPRTRGSLVRVGPRSTAIRHQVATTLHTQEANGEPEQYLQVPVDDVVLVDVVNALQNLMYTVATKAEGQEMSARV